MQLVQMAVLRRCVAVSGLLLLLLLLPILLLVLLLLLLVVVLGVCCGRCLVRVPCGVVCGVRAGGGVRVRVRSLHCGVRVVVARLVCVLVLLRRR